MTNAQILKKCEDFTMDGLLNFVREDESDKHANVIKRESYRDYIEKLYETSDNDTEADQKERTVLAVAWLEDVLSYYVNKSDGECIKISITDTFQR